MRPWRARAPRLTTTPSITVAANQLTRRRSPSNTHPCLPACVQEAGAILEHTAAVGESLIRAKLHATRCARVGCEAVPPPCVLEATVYPAAV